MEANILVVDDTPDNLRLLMGILTERGYRVRPMPTGAQALSAIQAEPPDVILLDIKMPGMSGYEVCEQLKADEDTRDIPVIFLSALNEVVDKVKGFEVGGVDYITKPFQVEEVLARVETHLMLQKYRHHLEELVEKRTADLQEALTEIQQLKDQLQAENIYLREEIRLEHNFDNIIGQSGRLKEVLFNVEQVAPTDTTVLILGETGTGKELIARAIHNTSPRKDRPLVKVNCAALPAYLIESELFGHEKGAFTGATTKQIGRFELANGATIFLDELGELPLELQAKLLRVLQDGEFERLGSPRTIKVDVRVIAATNRDLETEVRTGRFRQDLYYRLSVYPLSVPPLGERPDDIPLLVQAFVQKFNKKLGKQIETIPQNTMDVLQRYTWPGNVRELENVIERAIVLTTNQFIDLADFPQNIIENKGVKVDSQEQSIEHSESFMKSIETYEKKLIFNALMETRGNMTKAAQRLGMKRTTLRYKMEKYDLLGFKFE